MTRILPLAALAATVMAVSLTAQQSDSVPALVRHDLDGPRIGVTFISGPRAEQRLQENNLQPVMSLIGWHFEQTTKPVGGGPQLVLEQVLVVAGLDQGTAIPSGSLLVGVRTANGLEFGMGPNVSPVGVALAIGLGKSFTTGGVTIPLNLALVMSQGALRTSFLIGYALRRS